MSIFDKGAIVALPYGVEGFATPRHLLKEDGTTCKVDEKLPFKVIEFSKAAKRIILSHTRTWEESKKGDKDDSPKKDKKSSGSNKSSDKAPKISLEKTTLGDLVDLSKLMDKSNNAE
jgi:small subunit ribosomal protein S1